MVRGLGHAAAAHPLRHRPSQKGHLRAPGPVCDGGPARRPGETHRRLPRQGRDPEVFLTEKGLQKKKDELEYLRTVTRNEVADKIRVARGFGDLSENAESSFTYFFMILSVSLASVQ